MHEKICSAMHAVNASLTMPNPQKLEVSLPIAGGHGTDVFFLLSCAEPAPKIQLAPPAMTPNGTLRPASLESIADLTVHLRDWLKAHPSSPRSKDGIHDFIEEFVFFYNRKEPNSQGRAFYDILGGMLNTPPPPTAPKAKKEGSGRDPAMHD
jgi:hypothetical protein